MTSTPIEQFQRFVSEAEWFNDHYDLDQMPSYQTVMSHIEAHPQHRAEFGCALLQTLKDGGDGHLFMYCMGRLKWPEVEAELVRWMHDAAAKGDIRSKFFFGGVLQCFQSGYVFP